MSKDLLKLALNVREAAHAVGVSEDVITHAYRSGKLKPRYVGERGGRVVIRVADLEEWLASLPQERSEPAA